MIEQRFRDGLWATALVRDAVLVGAMVGGQGALSAGEPALKWIQTIELQGKAGKLDHLVVGTLD